jgi:heme o synthase
MNRSVPGQRRGEVANVHKAYIRLTKPGILFGNGITTLAGFFLAAKGHIHLGLLFATVVGVSLGIASACVCNNCLDRGIDATMQRTQSRALVTGIVSPRSAMIFAVMLGILGLTLLGVFTNALTFFIEIVGIIFYVGIYTQLKRFSEWSTVVGSVSGAIPPLAGYAAVAGKIDAGALILFVLVVLWQMPHFYALAIYRLADYQAAGVPVLPATKGIFVTKVHILLYTIGFVIVSTVFAFTEFAGNMYPALVAILSLSWLVYAACGFSAKSNSLWARQIFAFSLLVIVVLCTSIVAGSSFI